MNARSLVLLSALLAPLPANAQPRQRDAAAFFGEGASAYARGDFRAAALAFEEAYRRAPRGATIYNAAIAWEQAKSLERAADDFEAAVADPAIDSKHAADARARLAALEQSVGVVDVGADPGVLVSVAHVERAHAPVRVHLLPGAHEVRAEYPSGQTRSEQVTVAAAGVTRVSFPAEPRPAASAPSALAAPPPQSASQSPAPSRENRGTWATTGWVLLGGGVVAGAAASTFGLVALGARSDFENSGETNASAHDRAATFRTGANVAWAGTALLLGAGAFTLLVLSRDPGK